MSERSRFPIEWCRVASSAQSWWKKRPVRQGWLGQPGRRGFGKHSYSMMQLPSEPQWWKEHPYTEELNAKCSKNDCNKWNMHFLPDWPETNCGKRNSQVQEKYSDTSLPEEWNGEKLECPSRALRNSHCCVQWGEEESPHKRPALQRPRRNCRLRSHCTCFCIEIQQLEKEGWAQRSSAH